MQWVTSCGMPAGAPHSLPASLYIPSRVVRHIYSQGKPRACLGIELEIWVGEGATFHRWLSPHSSGPKVKKLIKFPCPTAVVAGGGSEQLLLLVFAIPWDRAGSIPNVLIRQN